VAGEALNRASARDGHRDSHLVSPSELFRTAAPPAGLNRNRNPSNPSGTARRWEPLAACRPCESCSSNPTARCGCPPVLMFPNRCGVLARVLGTRVTVAGAEFVRAVRTARRSCGGRDPVRRAVPAWLEVDQRDDVDADEPERATPCSHPLPAQRGRRRTQVAAVVLDVAAPGRGRPHVRPVVVNALSRSKRPISGELPTKPRCFGERRDAC
jgi:hypothetical protein